MDPTPPRTVILQDMILPFSLTAVSWGGMGSAVVRATVADCGSALLLCCHERAPFSWFYNCTGQRYIFLISQDAGTVRVHTAMAAIPSFLPTNPRCSVVVALIDTSCSDRCMHCAKEALIWAM